MQENWLLRFYQDTGMSGLCGKATYGYVAKNGLICGIIYHFVLLKSP